MTDIFQIICGILGGYNPFQTGSALNPSHYVPPTLDEITTDGKGYPVLHITAQSYRDAGKFTEGTTYPGDVSRALVHLDGDKWEVRIEEWDKRTVYNRFSINNTVAPKGMTQEQYQEWIDKQRGC